MKIILFVVLGVFICSFACASDIRIVDRDGDMVDIEPDGSLAIKANPNCRLLSGFRDVTTAGTAIVASSDTVCNRIIVKASLSNTGDVYVGGSNVSADAKIGIPLDAGDVWIGTVDNLNKVFLDSTVSGEGVSFTYEN